MNHTISVLLATLTLTACSQEFTRYDPQPGTVPSALYRSITGDTGGFSVGFEAIKAGEYAAAEAPLMRHLQDKPNDPYALLAMGAVMEQTGREAQALPYYSSAALHGGNATLGGTVSLDAKDIAPEADTVREVAQINIARLR